MEFNEKRSNSTKIGIFLGIIFIQFSCNYSEVDCDEFSRESALFFNEFYIDNNEQKLDSALFYTNKSLDHCDKYKNFMSLRKLSILSEIHNYTKAIEFIETFEKNMFSDLPYYQKLLIERFNVMKSINDGDDYHRDKSLNKCISD